MDRIPVDACLIAAVQFGERAFVAPARPLEQLGVLHLIHGVAGTEKKVPESHWSYIAAPKRLQLTGWRTMRSANCSKRRGLRSCAVRTCARRSNRAGR